MDNKTIYKSIQEVKEDQKEITSELIEHRVLFKEHLKQDERMYEEIKDIKETLIENTADLKHHIQRTDILQQNQTIFLETIKKIQEAVDSISTRVDGLEQPEKAKRYLYKQWMSIFKIIAAAGAAGAVISKYMGWI